MEDAAAIAEISRSQH
ncbi:hypothetical protein OK016_29335 [Vibrio chagasii]|nr:hypothetical protein [Vibrio chagasii]